ncbi:prolyl oligopeptidase family serine peptidase [Enterocloster sp.]|uniref:prolyl oligopeptidase family serine peptidase n=1 Tax=Enterocloster sp. TaxID=2719315 RepID=UPI0039A00252
MWREQDASQSWMYSCLGDRGRSGHHQYPRGRYMACDKRQKEMIEPMLAGLNRVCSDWAELQACRRIRFRNQSGIKRAVRFAKANAKEWTSADRLAAWGGSAGGYMTLMGCLCAGTGILTASGPVQGNGRGPGSRGSLVSTD